MTAHSKTQFELLKSVADGISALFFPCVEVVIHELATQNVAYIANNFSKRKQGDDSGLDGFELHDNTEVTGPYEKLNWDGRKLRSVSVVTKDTAGQPAYILCINMNTSIIEDARNALDMFLSITHLQPQPEQLFKNDWQEKINKFLYEWMKEKNTSLQSLSRLQKKELVQSLYHQGAFGAKSAVDYIANVLSLGRTTVYKYLRELKATT